MLPRSYRGRYSIVLLLSLLVHVAVIVIVLMEFSEFFKPERTEKTVTISLKQKEEPKKEEPKKEEPKKEEPKKEEQKKEEPKKSEAKKAEAKKEEAKKEEAKKEELKKTDPKKEEPKKAEPKKAEPKKADPKKEEPKKAEPKKVEPKKAEAKKAEAKQAEAKKAEPKKAEPKNEELKKIPEDMLLSGYRVNDSLNYNQWDLKENTTSKKEQSKNAFFKEDERKASKNVTNNSLNDLKQLEEDLGMSMLDDAEMGMAFVTTDVSRRVVNFNSTNFFKLIKDEENRNKLAASLSNTANSFDNSQIADLKKLNKSQKMARESYLLKGGARIINNIEAPPYDGKKYYGQVKLYVSLQGDFLKIILEPSGNTELDNAVINAINKTASIDMPDDKMIALSMRSIAFWYNEETMAGYPNY